jgi:uncharacterized protein YodC (DUF2158 family)
LILAALRSQCTNLDLYIGAYMLTATCTQMANYFVGDVVTLKAGGPRMTITGINAGGNWLRCQWFDEHGELRQELFSQEDVQREPRSLSPGAVRLRSYANTIRTAF